MTDYTRQLAQGIVSAILLELRGRSGIGDTITATAPDGTGITIEIRPNKKV